MMLASDFWTTDFAIGQDRSDLLVWLRRPGADANGDPPFAVRGVFRHGGGPRGRAAATSTRRSASTSAAKPG